jgi:hypothetical protein
LEAIEIPSCIAPELSQMGYNPTQPVMPWTHANVFE